MKIGMDRKTFGRSGLLLTFLVSVSAFGQVFPSKHISITVGFATGATTDLSARALGDGLEKVLGVPIVVDNKAGNSSTIAAAFVARQKPDGYTLGVVSTGAFTVRPHLTKTAYDPLKDFTLIAQYARYIGALTVRTDAPFKTVNEFVAYAKAHPGISYSSAGASSPQHLSMELFRQCKGLEFTHLPTKGGSDAINLLMGKHVEFTAGSGSHVPYVRQGRFRNLVVFNTDERDPDQPEVPTMKDLGCKDAPQQGYVVIGPKGLPDPVYKVLSDAIRKVAEGPDFQKSLVNLNIPYDYKDRSQLEKEVVEQFNFYKTYLEKMGVKPE